MDARPHRTNHLRQCPDGRAPRPHPRGDGRLLGVRRPRRRRQGLPARAPRRARRRRSRGRGCREPRGAAPPAGRLLAVDPGQPQPGPRRPGTPDRLDAPDHRQHPAAGARGDAPRARAAAGGGPEPGRDRQLGVGRPHRHRGLVRPALPDLPPRARGLRGDVRRLPGLRPPRGPGAGQGGGRIGLCRRRGVRLGGADHPQRRAAGLGARAGPGAAWARRRAAEDGGHGAGHHRAQGRGVPGGRVGTAAAAAAGDGQRGQRDQQPRRGARAGRGRAPALHRVGPRRRAPVRAGRLGRRDLDPRARRLASGSRSRPGGPGPAHRPGGAGESRRVRGHPQRRGDPDPHRPHGGLRARAPRRRSAAGRELPRADRPDRHPAQPGRPARSRRDRARGRSRRGDGGLTPQVRVPGDHEP